MSITWMGLYEQNYRQQVKMLNDEQISLERPVHKKRKDSIWEKIKRFFKPYKR